MLKIIFIFIGINVPIFPPSSCVKCGSDGKINVIPSLNDCYLVTKEGILYSFSFIKINKIINTFSVLFSRAFWLECPDNSLCQLWSENRTNDGWFNQSWVMAGFSRSVYYPVQLEFIGILVPFQVIISGVVWTKFFEKLKWNFSFSREKFHYW